MVDRLDLFKISNLTLRCEIPVVLVKIIKLKADA